MANPFNPFDNYNPFEDMSRRILDQQQKYFEDLTRPMREAQQAMSDSLIARITSIEWPLPSINAAALGLDSTRQLEALVSSMGGFDSASKLIEQAQSAIQASLPNVFQGITDNQREQMNALVSGAVSGLAKQVAEMNAAQIPAPDFSSLKAAAAGIAAPNFAEIIPPFLADYLTQALHKPISDFDEIDMEDAISRISELVVRRISESGKSTAALYFWLGALLSLLLFFIASRQSDKGTDELKSEIGETRKEIVDSRSETINRVAERVLEIIKGTIPEANNEAVYIVERPANLRVRPSGRSAPLSTLRVNQMVSVFKSPGKWVYVQYYDFNDGVPRTGWVLKKYLKRVK